MLRAAAYLTFLFAAMVFPAVMTDADEAKDGQPPMLLEWPMLQGESLGRLAQLIYPHDAPMQRRFISAAMRENPATFTDHPANRPFDRETLIWLPDLKQLANLAASSSAPRHFLRPALPAMQPSAKGADPSRLQMSAELQAPSGASAMPEQPATAVALQTAANIRHLNAAPAYDRAAMQEMEALMARNQALRQEQETLDARIATLEADISRLGEAIARDRPRTPRRIKQVKKEPAAESAKVEPAPPGFADSLQPPSPLHLLTGSAVLLAGVVILWLRRRHSNRKAEAAAAAQVAKEVEPDFGPPSTLMVIEENFIDDFISVDEVASVVEEAKVFVALGRTERAIELLEDYIATHPRASANPWLYLMEIHRGGGRKDEFNDVAKRFHHSLNVIAPLWESTQQANLVVPRSLDEFPHILQRLTDSWGTLDAQDFLNHLLQDNRGGERQGFSMEVLQEILLLLAILELRDHMPPLQAF